MVNMGKKVLLKVLADRPVTYHADFAKVLGSVTAGLFLCQCIYWTGKGSMKGWFYKSREDWRNELGMSRKEQETARKRLKNEGVLEEQLKGLPARLYYRVNFNRLIEMLRIYYNGPGKSSWPESSQLVGTNMTSREDQKSLPYLTEMTSNVVVDEQVPADEKKTNTENVCSAVIGRAAFDFPAPVDEHYDPNSEKKLAWEDIRSNVREIAGVDISRSLAKEIVRDYSPAKISLVLSELRNQLDRGIEIRSIGGWLRYVLRNITSDQAIKRSNKDNRTARARSYVMQGGSYIPTKEQKEKKKAFIRSLYV